MACIATGWLVAIDTAISCLCAFIFRVQSNHEFTRAQIKLTRAQARVGPGVDTPLVKGIVYITHPVQRCTWDRIYLMHLLSLLVTGIATLHW